MPASLGNHPRYLEELRIGGGYDSPSGGGADFDKAGNIAANGSLELDGNATIGGDTTIDGDLALNGVNTGWSVYLPASLGMPDPALPSGPVTPTNWRNYQVATPTLAFDPNSPEAAYFQFHLPKNYDGRPLRFTIEWSATAGTTGVVRWGLNPLSFGNGSTLVETGTHAFVEDTFISQESLHSVDLDVSIDPYSGRRLTTLRFLRDASNVGDTFDADALLIGLKVDVS